MKLLLLILLPLASFGQIDTVYNQSLFVESYSYFPEKDGSILVGKHHREGWQFLAISAAAISLGAIGIISGDKTKVQPIEDFGNIILITGIPFVIIGINRHYKGSVNQEYLEYKYPRYDTR